MPEWDAKEIVHLFYVLLPGFVTAWIFYGLTAHPRLDWFERLVQALIFTVIVQALVYLLRLAIHGRDPWTAETNLSWSLVLAVVLGIALSAAANTNWVHEQLVKWKVTKRTSYPSEWYSAFCREERYVTLHLIGNRRLFGWPAEWPDRPDKGHFVIEDAEWLLSDGERATLHNVHKVVVAADQVEMVEFVKYDAEVSVEAADVEAARNLLLMTQQPEQESDNGSKDTDVTTQSQCERAKSCAPEVQTYPTASTSTEEVTREESICQISQ